MNHIYFRYWLYISIYTYLYRQSFVKTLLMGFRVTKITLFVVSVSFLIHEDLLVKRSIPYAPLSSASLLPLHLVICFISDNHGVYSHVTLFLFLAALRVSLKVILVFLQSISTDCFRPHSQELRCLYCASVELHYWVSSPLQSPESVVQLYKTALQMYFYKCTFIKSV